MEAYLYIGTQGAMAEANEAEHFVPTKRLTPYDWERMKESINSEKEGPDVHERHKLEINPELDEAVPPAFHLHGVHHRPEGEGAGGRGWNRLRGGGEEEEEVGCRDNRIGQPSCGC